MLGNKGKIDTLGKFLFINTLGFIDADHDEDTAVTHIATRISPDFNTGKIKSLKKIQLRASSNCWIWEGWSEVKFEWTPGISSSEPHNPDEPIYLHLSCDDFTEDLLLPDPDKSGTYSSLRMVPPGDLQFYFSFGTKNVVAEDQPKKATSTVENIVVPKTNILENIIQTNTWLTKTYLTNMIWFPRPPPKMLLSRARLRTPWDFFKSIFRTYKPDDKETLEACFEYDWENTKIHKIVKNNDELSEVKDFLKDNYKFFRETYKYYSAFAPAGLIFSIGTNTFSDIISNCPGLVDNDTLKLSDLDLEFVATNAGVARHKFNPERQICRHEFMEIFVRIAITKYYKTKQVDSIPQAVFKIFNSNLKDFFVQFDCHKWRRERLWNEAWDLAFKRNMATFEKIYKQNSGRYALPGAVRYMSLDEFFDLITGWGVVDDTFGKREIGCLYCLSMMTQKNELDNDKHLNMILAEFIEATGRVADKLNIPPLVDENENEEDKIPDEKFHENLRRRFKNTYPNLGLDYKIETLIYLMARSCLKKPDIEVMEKSIQKFYEDKKNAPKAKRYGISDKQY